MLIFRGLFMVNIGNGRRDAGCWKMPTAKLNERCQVIADFVGSIMMLLCALGILIYLTGCTGEMCIGMKHFDSAHDERALTSKK